MPVDNIASLSMQELSGLSDQEIAGLTMEQISTIARWNLFSENQWASSFLSRLNSTQIKALSPTLFSTPIWGFDGLSTEFYQALTPAQLSQIHYVNLLYWDGRQIRALSAQQVQSFDMGQIKALTNKYYIFDQNDWAALFLNKLTTSQIQALNEYIFTNFIWGFEYLSDYFYVSLTPKQIASIGDRNLEYWGANQLKNLTRQDQIDALSTRSLNIISSNNANLFDQNIWAASFLGRLTASQIQAINPKVFKGSIWDFQRLPTGFFQALSTNQIAEISDWNLQSLGAQHLDILSREQIQSFSAKQIAAITNNKIDLFGENTWAATFLNRLTAEQIRAIPAYLFSSRIWGFENLTDAFYRALTPEQLSYVYVWNLQFWGERQLSILSGEQIKAFSASQIGSLTFNKSFLFDQKNWSSGFLSALSFNQIQALDPSVFRGYLWGFEYYPASFYQALTSAQISEINSWNLQFWDARHLNALSSGQITALTNSQIAVLSVNSIQELSGVQISALSGRQLKAILNRSDLSLVVTAVGSPRSWSDTQIRNLSTQAILDLGESIRQFNSRAILNMNLDGAESVLGHLSVEQVGSLSPYQIATLVNNKVSLFSQNSWSRAFLGKLSFAQVQAILPSLFAYEIHGFGSLPATFYQALTPNQISAIAYTNLKNLSAAQLSGWDLTQVQALNPGQINALTESNLTLFSENNWARGFLSALTVEQVRSLSPSSLGVRIWEFDFLASDFIKALKPEQIAAIGEWNIQRLGAYQLNVLSSEQINALTSRQIAALTKGKVNLFEAGWWPESTRFLSTLNAVQVQAIDPCVFELSILGFDKLPETFYRALTSAQITGISNSNMASWGIAQFSLLNVDQIKALTLAQLASSTLNNKRIFENNHSAEGFLTKLSSEQIQALNPGVFSYKILGFENLSNNFYRALTSTQIASIGLNNLGYWQSQQLSVLSVEQVQAFSTIQIATILNAPPALFNENSWAVNLLGKLSTSQIKVLEPQLLSAKIWGFERLPASFYKALTPQQISSVSIWNLQYWGSNILSELTKEQIGGLTSAQVSALSKEQIVSITPKAFSGFAVNQIAALSKAQIDTIFNHPNLWRVMLDLGGVDAWSVHQFAALSDDVVKNFSIAILNVLTAEQFQSIVRVRSGEYFVRDDGFPGGVWTKEQLMALSPRAIGSLSADQLRRFVNSSAELGISIKHIQPSSLASMPHKILQGLSCDELACMSGDQLLAMMQSPELAKLLNSLESSGGWSASQIKALSATAISRLPSNIIANILPGNLACLTGNHLAALNPSQIKALTVEQLKSLAAVNPKLFDQNNWAGNFLASLNPSQISTLDPNVFSSMIWGFEKLPVSFYKILSPVQISAIHKWNLGYWSDTQLTILSKEQIQAFSADQISSMTTNCQIDLFHNNDWAEGFFSTLTKSQIQAISPRIFSLNIRNLQNLPSEFFRELSVDQLANYDLHSLSYWGDRHIAALSSAQINSLGSLAYLNPRLIQNFTNTQIADLSGKHIYGLMGLVLYVGGKYAWTGEQIGQISAKSINELRDKISHFYTTTIPYLNFKDVDPGVLAQLTPAQFAIFTKSQIGGLTASQFSAVATNPKLAAVITNIGASGAWTVEQIGQISAEAINTLDKNIANINSSAIPYLNFKDVNPGVLAQLTPAQFAIFTKSQIASLTASQFSAVATNPKLAAVITNIGASGAWTVEQIGQISAEAINTLNKNIANINSSAIPYLNFKDVNPGVLAQLTPTQLAIFTKSQIASLTASQFSAVAANPKLAAVVTNIGYLGCWTIEQYNALTLMLPGVGGAAMLPSDIAKLSIEQFRSMLISAEKTGVFTNVGSPGCWTEQQISSLSSAVIKQLGDDIARFNAKAILSMNFNGAENTLGNLTSIQIEATHTGISRMINLMQLPHIFDQNNWAGNFLSKLNLEQIQSVSPNLFSAKIWGFEFLPENFFRAITPEQISHISDWNLQLLSEKQFKFLAFDQISAVLIRLPNIFFNSEWGTSYLKDLTEGQIKRLPAKSLAGNLFNIGILPTSFFQALTLEQISAIPESMLFVWGDRELSVLSSEQIRAFSPAQISALTANKPNLFEKNSWAWEFLYSLSSSQIKALQPISLSKSIWHFDYLYDRFLRLLQPEQISAIHFSNIANLSARAINLLSAEQVKALTKLQIICISLETIQGLAGSQISALEGEQLNAIFSGYQSMRVVTEVGALGSWSSDQVAYLSSKAINALGRDIRQFNRLGISSINLYGVDPKTLAEVSASQLNAFSNSQISALTVDQLTAMLNMPELAAVIANTGTQGSWSRSQFASLSNEAANFLSPALHSMHSLLKYDPTQIASLTSDQLQEILSNPALAGIVSNVGADYSWTAEQISNLSSSAVSGLGRRIVVFNARAISAMNFIGVDSKTLVQLNSSQLEAFTHKQIANLSSDQFQNLLGSTLGSVIFSPGEYGSWSLSKFLSIPVRLFQSLDKKIASFSLSAISKIDFSGVDPKTIAELTPTQLYTFSNEQISHLNSEQIKALLAKAELATLLANVNLGGSWTKAQFASVSTSAIGGLGQDIALLGMRAVNQMNGDQIQAISDKSVSYLDLAALNNTTLVTFSQRMIGALSVEQIRGITPIQLSIILSKAELKEVVLGSGDNLHSWAPEKFQALSRQAISSLSAVHVREMSSKQIAALSPDQFTAILAKPELAAVITNVGANGSWTQRQFSSLPATFLNTLTLNQTRDLGVNALVSLSGEHINLMSVKQVNTLFSNIAPSLFKIGQVGAWNQDQFNSINRQTFLGLNRSTLAAIPEKYFKQKLEKVLGDLAGEDNISPDLISLLNEEQIILVIKKIGVRGLTAKQVAKIAPSILQATKNNDLIGLLNRLEPFQLGYLSDSQMKAIISNDSWIIPNQSSMKGKILSWSTMQDKQSEALDWLSGKTGKIGDEIGGTREIISNLINTPINSRSIYTYTTLIRAVWGSQTFYEQANVNQALATYERNLRGNNLNSMNRHNYQVLRGLLGGVSSWGMVSNYLYQASITSDEKKKAAYTLQGVSYFLTSLKPLSGVFNYALKNGLSNALDGVQGKKLTIIELGSDFIVDKNGVADLSKRVIGYDEFNSFYIGEQSLSKYLIYQTNATSQIGEVSHLYIQKISNLGAGAEMTPEIEILQRRTNEMLGIKNSSGDGMEAPNLKPAKGREIWEMGIRGVERTEEIKLMRELAWVQKVADVMSIANSVAGLVMTKQDGNYGATRANIQNAVTITTSLINLASDFYGPTTGASARALKMSSTAFAVSNLMNNMLSLTLATMDVIDIAKNPNASTGERVSAYGTLSATGFLSALSLISMIQPQFAPAIFIGATLMPNFQGIGQAIDIKEKIEELERQGQHVYAKEILGRLYQLAIANSLPIINWFSLISSQATLTEISKKMGSNEHQLVWTAIKELHEYEQLRTEDSRARINAIGRAIYEAGNAFDALLITAVRTATSQFYVDNGRVLNYATGLTIYRGGSAYLPDLEVYKGSQNGVVAGRQDYDSVWIEYGSNDRRQSINAIVSGDQNVSINIDVRNYSGDGKAKDNTFEIQKNNVTIYGNALSKILLDVGMVSDLNSIHFQGDAVTWENSIQLEDASGLRNSLELNLDIFSTSSGRAPAIKGFLSQNFDTSFITGTKAHQKYIFGGGMDDVEMLGGNSEVIIGGSGSRLLMANGGNRASIIMDVGDKSKGPGIYDGGSSGQENGKLNTIDFSYTEDNDLIFVEKRLQDNQVEGVSWTEVYGYSSFIDMTAFKENSSKNISQLSMIDVIDSAKFTNFDILHTGSSSNYIDISGNTNISQIILDGKSANYVNLDVSSIKNGVGSQLMMIDSALSGSTEINLKGSLSGAVSINGRGGELLVNTEKYSGDLMLDLMNTGDHSTVINDQSSAAVPGVINATIRGGGSGKFGFHFSQWRSAYVETKSIKDSNIDITESGEMTDDASLIINTQASFSDMAFSISGKRLIANSMETQRQFLSLDWGSDANFDNIFFTDGLAKNDPATYVVELDSLVQAMATLNASGNMGHGFVVGQQTFYAGNQISEIISASKL